MLLHIIKHQALAGHVYNAADIPPVTKMFDFPQNRWSKHWTVPSLIRAVFEGLNPCSSSMKARDENTLSKSHVKYKFKGNKGGNKQIWKSNQHFPKAQELICIRFWDHVLFISNHNQSGEKLINESVSRSDIRPSGGHTYLAFSLTRHLTPGHPLLPWSAPTRFPLGLSWAHI